MAEFKDFTTRTIEHERFALSVPSGAFPLTRCSLVIMPGYAAIGGPASPIVVKGDDVRDLYNALKLVFEPNAIDSKPRAVKREDCRCRNNLVCDCE